MAVYCSLRFKYLCMSSYFRLLVRILEACAHRHWQKAGLVSPQNVTSRCVHFCSSRADFLCCLLGKQATFLTRLIIFAALLLVVFFGFAVAFSKLVVKVSIASGQKSIHQHTSDSAECR